MSTSTQALRILRRLRTDLVLAALVATASLLAVPRPTHPEPVPTAPAVAGTIPGQDGLCRLIASLDLGRPEPVTPSPDRHALRRQVTPFAVRLVVDPAATHPLDGRLTVRQTHLGGPAKPWRLVSLALPPVDPEPAAQPVATQAAAPEPEKTLPAVASAAPQPVAVKNPSTPPTPPRAAPVRPLAQAPSSPPGRSVLVAGDSLSIFLADALRPLLAGRPGTTFAAKGKVSSGLARPDFFDWEREMARQSAATRADTVLIMIATNDNQTLTRPDGAKVAFGRPGWEAEYTRRVRRLVELARSGNSRARIYWIGAPVMADARLNADVAAINAILARQVASLPGCRFVDVSRTLADAKGRYAPSLSISGGTRPIRTKDGVHLMPYGARLLAEACLASMSPTLAALGR